MKVAFLHNSLKAGGIERTVDKLSDYLINQNCEVVVILTQKQKKHYTLRNEVKCLEVSEQYPKASTCRAILNNLANIIAVRKAIRQEKPDVLICMNSSIVICGVFAALFTKTKIIGTEQANPYISLKGSIWYYLKFLFSFFTDGYVFQTKRASLFYPRRVHNKSWVIENAVIDYDFLAKYDPDSTKISAVGSLRPVKGFDILINAFAQLPESFNVYKLIIYGEGELRLKLEKQIEDCGLKGRAVLAGNSDNILDSIKDSCLYVLSSFHEGMPNSLMEAMSLGIPCISTDCPMGPRELIKNGENGLLAPVGDSIALSNAIKTVLSDKSLRIRISQKAIKICDTHSLETIGGQWLEYITKIANK